MRSILAICFVVLGTAYAHAEGCEHWWTSCNYNAEKCFVSLRCLAPDELANLVDVEIVSSYLSTHVIDRLVSILTRSAKKTIGDMARLITPTASPHSTETREPESLSASDGPIAGIRNPAAEAPADWPPRAPLTTTKISAEIQSERLSTPVKGRPVARTMRSPTKTPTSVTNEFMVYLVNDSSSNPDNEENAKRSSFNAKLLSLDGRSYSVIPRSVIDAHALLRNIRKEIDAAKTADAEFKNRLFMIRVEDVNEDNRPHRDGPLLSGIIFALVAVVILVGAVPIYFRASRTSRRYDPVPRGQDSFELNHRVGVRPAGDIARTEEGNARHEATLGQEASDAFTTIQTTEGQHQRDSVEENAGSLQRPGS